MKKMMHQIFHIYSVTTKRKKGGPMGVTLEKGERLSLTKEGGKKLSKIMVGLGWDPVKAGIKRGFFNRDSANFDLDASVFEINNGAIVDTIYYGHLRANDGSIYHQGDNLTGDGDGDDEQILISLDDIPERIDKLVFVVNIYDCNHRKQDFGMIQNAFIRLVDDNTGKEICKYNLSENYEGKTAMIMGSVYRHNGEWKFSAIGEGTNDSSISEMKRRNY